MRILLCQPQTPITFWSFDYALKFVSKKTAEPPLGLLTVAAMLPESWDLKLVDMNVSTLKDEHIEWADYVFLTGMNVHMNSMKMVIGRCNEIGTKVVAGGPLCTLNHAAFEGVSHFVLNEAEMTLPTFLADLENGKAKYIYRSDNFPSLEISPAPMWSLIDMRKYSSMTLQYSRGCPFNCEFCNISNLNGHKPRTKSKTQIIAELDGLYNQGWRNGVFIVDDNFIGHKRKLKTAILPAITAWQQSHKVPFSFMTEVSINLADDDDLLQMMVDAGFDSAFVGIETPEEKSLSECGKKQNQQRNLVDSVKKLQRNGLIVSGGFIVGFDNDSEDIFDKQIRFIQQSGITTAMVGLLNAPTGTRLYKRMEKENRLTGIMSGNNTDGSMNFVPKMNYIALKAGHKRVLTTIYSPPNYLRRLKTFLGEYRMPAISTRKINKRNILAFFKAMWILGVVEKGRKCYWKLLLHCLCNYPRKIPTAVELAIYGFHFRKMTRTL